MSEGRTYVVLSKKDGNKFVISFRSWADVENYVANEENVYKIISLDCYDIPLTGLRLKGKT